MWTPPDTEAYNRLVWTIVQQIPEGKVSTYGQIASMIPVPDNVPAEDYARMKSYWVGQALNATPSDQGIPWQRVINSQGAISLPKDTPAAHKQRVLLESEGVTFDEKDRVDLDLFGWEGPSEAWRQKHGLLAPSSLKRPPGSATQPRLF